MKGVAVGLPLLEPVPRTKCVSPLTSHSALVLLTLSLSILKLTDFLGARCSFQLWLALSLKRIRTD